MGKPKTVITENGAVYQLSDPSALRLVYRIDLNGGCADVDFPRRCSFRGARFGACLLVAQKDPAGKEISSLHRYAMRRKLHVWALGSQSTHRAGAT